MNLKEKYKKFLEKDRVEKVKGIVKENQLFMVAFIFFLALILRLWKIDTIPPGFSPSEAPVVDTLKKMSWNNMWLGGQFARGGYLYIAFLWTKIFGLKVLTLRILSVIIGSLTVLLSYVFISKWFSRKIAIFTAFLFAISSFHITISRLIVPETLLPFSLLFLFTILTDAYRNKNIWYFGLAGLLVGLGFYSSPAFLFVPFIFAISGAYFFRKNKKFFTAYREEIFISALGFFAGSLPFFVSFFQDPMSYLTYFGFNRSLMQLVMNIGQIPILLFSRTPHNYFLNIGTEPLLDPFITVTAIAGFLFALFSIQRRKYFFLITWLVFFALYAALKRGVQIIDLVGVLPIFYAFSALILDYVLDKWFTTFPYNKNARLAVIIVISIFFAMTTLYNYERYFVAYGNSREVRSEFSAKAPIPLR